MSKKKKSLKITKEQLLSIDRAARRLQDLDIGVYRPTVIHKDSKKDFADREPKIIKDWEDDR